MPSVQSVPSLRSAQDVAAPCPLVPRELARKLATAAPALTELRTLHAHRDDPHNRMEVKQALERSLWSPQYRPGYWSVFARHCAACWFMQCDDHPHTKAELEKCGEFYDENETPWNFPASRYSEIRKQVGL